MPNACSAKLKYGIPFQFWNSEHIRCHHGETSESAVPPVAVFKFNPDIELPNEKSEILV
jgi:hypothetical protein